MPLKKQKIDAIQKQKIYTKARKSAEEKWIITDKNKKIIKLQKKYDHLIKKVKKKAIKKAYWCEYKLRDGQDISLEDDRCSYIDYWCRSNYFDFNVLRFDEELNEYEIPEKKLKKYPVYDENTCIPPPLPDQNLIVLLVPHCFYPNLLKFYDICLYQKCQNRISGTNPAEGNFCVCEKHLKYKNDITEQDIINKRVMVFKTAIQKLKHWKKNKPPKILKVEHLDRDDNTCIAYIDLIHRESFLIKKIDLN